MHDTALHSRINQDATNHQHNENGWPILCMVFSNKLKRGELFASR